ncbi:uncharacterized protein LOC143642075 [Callospermophilus lateralis]|uniref:uncharacterized protein LOC143642075 n=1 Tax=Callospermophilus lateralis TaxID=76772 RepID=UPI004053E314
MGGDLLSWAVAIHRCWNQNRETWCHVTTDREEPPKWDEGGGVQAALNHLQRAYLLQPQVQKGGKFRKFGFIGFKSEEEAQAGLNHFNKSFIDTSRITTEKPASQKDPTTAHTVKLRGALFSVTEKNVLEFLAPLKPVAIRIVRNVHRNNTGVLQSGGCEELLCLQEEEHSRGAAFHGVWICGVPAARASPESPQTAAGSHHGRPQGGSADLRTSHQASPDLCSEAASPKQTSSKILVRNIPFQADRREIHELFRSLGGVLRATAEGAPANFQLPADWLLCGDAHWAVSLPFQTTELLIGGLFWLHPCNPANRPQEQEE